jgi:hypothetical protein
LLFLRSVRRLLVTASVVLSSPILVTLMKEALGSSETSGLTRAIWRNIPEDTILHSHRRENLKSYKNKFSLVNASYQLVKTFCLPVCSLRHKNQNMQKYSFVYNFVFVRKLASDIMGKLELRLSESRMLRRTFR